MRTTASCPRCARELQAPGLWSNSWICGVHGAVPPVHPVRQPTPAGIADLVAQAQVPAWLPWPLPHGWVVTGMSAAGDERSGFRATAVACSGPAPLGGVGELVMIAEEPGIGFGARFAGIDAADPGSAIAQAPATTKLTVGGHPTAMWLVEQAHDRTVYAGESAGVWLWVVLWPVDAGVMLADQLRLTDMRDIAGELQLLPVGALSPRLTEVLTPA